MGNVDSISSTGTVTGWAIDGDDPSRPARLVALLDGEPVATIICSILRPDVQAAVGQTAMAGFTFDLDDRIKDGIERSLSFRPAIGGEPFQLLGTQTVRLTEMTVGEVTLEREAKRLIGWIAAPPHSPRPVLVDVRVDGAPLTVVSCRPSSSQSADNKIPFTIAIPSEIIEDPNVRTIDVCVLGNGKHLSGSPIKSRSSKLIGCFERLRGRRISGWAFDMGLSMAPSLDVLIDGRHVMQIVCNVHRDDVDAVIGSATTCGFNAVLPLEALDHSPAHLSIKFSDGRELEGGPKHFKAIDLDLISLEMSLFGDNELNTQSQQEIERKISSQLHTIARILAAPPVETKDYRGYIVELGAELLEQAAFCYEPAEAFEVVRTLALVGLPTYRNADEFQAVWPVLEGLGKETADLYGLIDLERQRRRPFNRLLLAAMLFLRDRPEEGVDLIFDNFWTAKQTERNAVASLGANIMMRAGRGSDACSILVTSLLK